MRILHLSNSNSRDTTAGTEIFVEQLCHAQSNAHQIIWASHQSDRAQTVGRSSHANIDIEILPPIVKGNRSSFVSQRCHVATGFADLIDRFAPDLLHLHSWSDQCGHNHIDIARARGTKVVMTIHAPGFTCPQGSMMYLYTEICDGVIRDRKCTQCRLVNGGLLHSTAHVLAAYDWPMLSMNDSGRLNHLLTARQLTARFRLSWAEVIPKVDGFHVLCEWSRDVLARNGVSERKLHLIRTAGPAPLPAKQRRALEDGVLRCVYWGRCVNMKGLHLIVAAVKALPKDLPIEVSFYGPDWDTSYGQFLQHFMAGDPRFVLRGTLSKNELLPKLQGYDLALVPSLWQETGPLTVLEAFAAGIAVAGCDLGGVRELLRDKPGCYLLPPRAESWARLLHGVLSGQVQLTSPPQQNRLFSHVADELDELYRQACD